MQKSCSVTKDTQINNSTQVIRIGNKDIFFALSGKNKKKTRNLSNFTQFILHSVGIQHSED